ncbi:hypothetical protein ACFVTX_15080 [Agromyces sp. NPDC058136]|uniref:hypothetical protein n=1 Tax=Agromyces sp. NPDC058136 TaxID=3346354 RepID=UPI0036DCC2C9
MTDTEQGIDPRYDPRFQRGYDPSQHADATGWTGAAVSPGSAVAERGARAAAVPRETPELREPPPARIPPPPGREPADAAPDAGAPAGDGAADPVAMLGLQYPSDEPGPIGAADGADDAVTAPTARAWLIAGWAATGGAIALGIWMLWSLNGDYAYYYGGVVDPDGERLRILGWALAPSLVLAGAVGAVIVTGLAAGIAVEAGPGTKGDARFRRPPAWWVLPAIAVVGVALIAWAVALAVAGNAASSNMSFSPGAELSDGQREMFEAMVLGQVAQTLIGPAASAVVGAVVAVVVLEVRRAVRQSRVPARPQG